MINQDVKCALGKPGFCFQDGLVNNRIRDDNEVRMFKRGQVILVGDIIVAQEGQLA